MDEYAALLVLREYPTGNAILDNAVLEKLAVADKLVSMSPLDPVRARLWSYFFNNLPKFS